MNYQLDWCLVCLTDRNKGTNLDIFYIQNVGQVPDVNNYPDNGLIGAADHIMLRWIQKLCKTKSG